MPAPTIPTAALPLPPGLHGRTSPPQVAVEARALTRTYGTGGAMVRALHNVFLSVPKGQFVAVMGPSGSGKSTLLNCLAGLDVPTSGQVLIGDQSLSGMNDRQLTSVRRDKLGFIFQSFNLLPQLSAKENIMLPMRLAHRRVEEDWLEAVVTSLGIKDRLSHRPTELSGGQQQRVAVARALVGRPDVIFADEPTGALDSASAGSLLETLANLCDVMGQTVVMVTHDENAASVTNRVIRLRDGEVVGDDALARRHGQHAANGQEAR